MAEEDDPREVRNVLLAAAAEVDAGFHLSVPQGPIHRRRTSSISLYSTSEDDKLLIPQGPLTFQDSVISKVNGSIAYFRKDSNDQILMEKCRPSVWDLTRSRRGFNAMDEEWEVKQSPEIQDPGTQGSTKRIPAVPHWFRWIHLPGNDPEWVKV
jgi:hypothetical protein